MGPCCGVVMGSITVRRWFTHNRLPGGWCRCCLDLRAAAVVSAGRPASSPQFAVEDGYCLAEQGDSVAA